MLGAIIGDIVGSVYEGSPIEKKNFDLFRVDKYFTDDSVIFKMKIQKKNL